MKQLKSKYTIVFLLLLSMMISVIACGNAGQSESSTEAVTTDMNNASEEISESSETIEEDETANESVETEVENEVAESENTSSDAMLTKTDAMGHEVTYPENPQRIIASYLEDNLVALDVMPVAQWSLNDGASVLGYLQDTLKDVPIISFDLPYEAVQSFNPDLMLVESAASVEGEKYAQYSKIVPTYVITEEINNDWRTEFKTIADVLNKNEKAEQVLSEYETKADSIREAIEAKGEMPSAAAIWLTGGNFFIVSANTSSGSVMYEDLGLKVPAVVEEITAEAAANWNPISLEKLVELDADYIFMVNSMEEENPEVLSDALWNAVKAVQNENVISYEPDTAAWLYQGPIANTMILEDIEEALIK